MRASVRASWSFRFHATVISKTSLQKEWINPHKGEKKVKERRKMSGTFQTGFLGNSGADVQMSSTE